MFTEALFITAKNRNPSNILQQVNGLTVVYIHSGTYPAIKRNELLIHTAIWLTLQGIMLSRNRQAQNDIYFMTPFMK